MTLSMTVMIPKNARLRYVKKAGSIAELGGFSVL
jgi:hypothetical protein